MHFRAYAYSLAATVMLIAMALVLGFGNCAAETPHADEKSAGWNGTLGFGPMAIAKYTGGQALQILPLPLWSINYDETFYVEVQRVGVYALASDDKKIGLGLAVEPRLGFHASDGPKLSGMATRRDSLEGGITFDWDFDVFAISAAWFTDMTRSSRGSSARLSLYRPLLKNARGEIGLIASADHMSARTANYFFGVKPGEASLLRPGFVAAAGTNLSLGLGGTYRVGATRAKGAIIFGANLGRLARSAARSPIVETNHVRQFYLGYGWAL